MLVTLPWMIAFVCNWCSWIRSTALSSNLAVLTDCPPCINSGTQRLMPIQPVCCDVQGTLSKTEEQVYQEVENHLSSRQVKPAEQEHTLQEPVGKENLGSSPSRNIPRQDRKLPRTETPDNKSVLANKERRKAWILDLLMRGENCVILVQSFRDNGQSDLPVDPDNSLHVGLPSDFASRSSIFGSYAWRHWLKPGNMSKLRSARPAHVWVQPASGLWLRLNLILTETSLSPHVFCKVCLRHWSSCCWTNLFRSKV